TSPAILADGLSRFRDMLSVVAAEATWELLVSDIVWIRSPTDAHVRKYILGEQKANRFRQPFQSRLVFQCRYIVTSRQRTRRFHFLCCDGLGHRRFRRFEIMAGSIVTVHAIHSTSWAVYRGAFERVGFISDGHNRNFLGIWTRGNVFDIALQMRLVDLRRCPHQKNRGLLSALLVVVIMPDHFQFVVLRSRGVAMFTRFARRPHTIHRWGNGSVIGAGRQPK